MPAQKGDSNMLVCPNRNVPRILLLSAITAATAMFGQTFYGGLRGVVRDPNGSMVAKVKVTLTDQAIGINRTTYTSDDGEYSFNQVVPSTYSVVLEVQGFKRFEQKDVSIA